MRRDKGRRLRPRQPFGTPQKVTGVLRSILFRKDDFVIGRLDSGVSVKGSLPEPQIGMSYELRGHWEQHPRFGRQFLFDAWRTSLPRDIEAIRAYLQENAKWVGPEVSKRLVDAYGPATLDVCKADPERVAREVSGITAERAGDIARMLRDIERSEKLHLELAELLGDVRITRRAIGSIIEKWKSDAPRILRENPYLMALEIDGVGFLTADEVGKRLNFDLECQPRVRSGLLHLMKTACGSEGHACLPEAVLTARAREDLDISEKVSEVEIETMYEAGLLSLDGDMVYLPEMLRAEKLIARQLKRLQGTAVVATKPEVADLQSDQIDAIIGAVTNAIFILTGAPGTGKTYTIRKIIDSFPDARIELAAPTGKAAKRIYEQTGRMARTIHKLLEPRFVDDVLEFTRNSDRPIDADLIVIDEMSMVDIRLFADLLSAIRPGTRLILVGDTYQLPSVGPGNVLRDLIASGKIPSQELTIIKRQDPGLIIANCHAIKAGKDVEVRNAPGSDFFLLVRETEGQIRDVILELVSKRLPESYDVHPLRDIQVISPLRERTPLSCKALNEVFQKTLNDAPLPAGSRFKIGDKVINKRNKYQLDIINGDIGYVRAVDPKEDAIVVDFENPDRRITLPLRENDLQLAYSITCHSFQGSEAPVIVIPIHKSFGTLIMQRNWLYTAVSRAKRVCVLVGQRDEVGRIIGRNRQQKRFTGLEGFLRDG